MFTSRRKKTASKLVKPVIMAALCTILLVQLQLSSSCIFNATRFLNPGANHKKMTNAVQPRARANGVYSLIRTQLSTATLRLPTAFVIKSLQSYWQRLLQTQLHTNLNLSLIINDKHINGGSRGSRRMRTATTTNVIQRRRRRYNDKLLLLQQQQQSQQRQQQQHMRLKTRRNHEYQFTTNYRDNDIITTTTTSSAAKAAAAAALRILLQDDSRKKTRSSTSPRPGAAKATTTADDTHLDYSQPQTHPPKAN